MARAAGRGDGLLLRSFQRPQETYQEAVHRSALLTSPSEKRRSDAGDSPKHVRCMHATPSHAGSVSNRVDQDAHERLDSLLDHLGTEGRAPDPPVGTIIQPRGRYAHYQS